MTCMTMNNLYSMMSRGASANCADAASSCARSAADNSIALILDAIMMASIIICALSILLVLGLSIVLLALSILAVLVLLVYPHLPGKRMRA